MTRSLPLLPHVRTERLIAIGRLLLAVCGLLAVVVDPPEFLADGEYAVLILSAYCLYAAVVLLALRLAHPLVLRHRLGIHVLDLVVFAMLVLVTGRTASPFFAPVVVLIVAATLRWQEVGAIRTGVAVLLFFVGTQLYDSSAGAVDYDTALVRYAFLTAAILLLAELGRLERTHGLRMMQVSRWPYPRTTERGELVAELLPRAAGAVGATRAVLVLEDTEEPWLELFSWSASQFSRSRVPQETEDPVVTPRLSQSPFLWTRGDQSVVYLSGDRSRLYHGAAIAQWFAPRVDAMRALALPLHGEEIAGHLFLLDAPDFTVDDLRLGEVLARHVSDSLQLFVLTEQLQAMTAADERVRISRDLHDGVLQTLAGIALKIATIRQLVSSSPETAREQLHYLERLIMDEQRDLRFFTLELRLRSGHATDGVLFPQTLGALLDRVQKIWGIEVAWRPHEAAAVPPSLAWETYQLVHEAIVNAARHGQASNAEVRLGSDPGALWLTVADNGTGFPFRGALEMEELRTQRRGPRSLRERVEALRGSMRIDSSPEGATVEISLPVNGRAA